MIYRTILYTGCLLYLLAAGEKYDKFTKKIPVNGEQTVEVNIEFNTGKLRIEPTDEDVILDGTFRYKKTEPEIDYRDGILDISAGKNEHKKEINITLNSFSDIKENECQNR